MNRELKRWMQSADPEKDRLKGMYADPLAGLG